MKFKNDDYLFRRITADWQTKNLIREWMEHTSRNYFVFRYRVFAKVLESVGMKGPFTLTYHGSQTFICEFQLDPKSTAKTQHTVFLRFLDTDSVAEVWVDSKEGRKVFNLNKEGKFVLSYSH